MDFSAFVIAVLLGIIPGIIAAKKGYSFVSWWIFGALLFIVALPMIIIKKPADITECPFCSEPIKVTATVCKHCNKEISAEKISNEL